ncbi:hypothetical protein KEC56_04795 [Microbacterium sp. YMB-B2]|uniref:Uncharacterized protein n=1 Tax=Microbacterium tenebrionis TaxID=2830665 RepID=A0A9X1LNB3_9MICO|nr:hypothetical protein [Microbacterium tenebrionis]MCC2028840.1 hypothetical protein [Microbacterium tenebrionis]
MASERKNQRGLTWALTGGAILLAGLIAIFVNAALNQPDVAPTTPPASTTASSPPATPPATDGDVVDPNVADQGWVPEPITTDPDLYIRRALEAASTFDTQLSERDEWLTYLDAWFTPDTRYTSETDQLEEMKSAQLELRQSLVLPEPEWDSLAQEDGRVTASVTGDIDYVDVPEDPSGDMRIGTADVTLAFTRTSGDGAETSYEETVRVSVQVLCGAGSVPTPDSSQQPGDCKIVRYFPEPMEP